MHYHSRDSVRFPIVFSLLCISSSIPQFGTVLVDRQCIWYSKDKVIDGVTSQKTKRESETTSKCVAQLLTEFESWSNQTNIQTSNLSFSRSNHRIYPCNASVACFPKCKTVTKKKIIIWRTNNSKVPLEHFGEFLSFASAKPNKSRR